MLRIALALALCTAASAADWLVGWQEASQAAKAQKKPILANFTGSDWCIACIKLDKEVFSKPEFAAWAKDRVVLLKVDFPQRKPLPAQQQAAHDAMAKHYAVTGFPTILILDADGRKLAAVEGYATNGVSAWTGMMDKILLSLAPVLSKPSGS